MQAHPPDLSAQEVNLLFDIIVRAQNRAEYPSQPLKVLLEEYDFVFAEHQLDTNHDRTCFRVLLQLAGPGIPGGSLFARFEDLLEQLGIRLELDDEALHSALHVDEEQHVDAVQGPPRPIADIYASPRKAARRNSFTSIYDLTADLKRRVHRRSPSIASESRIQHRPAFIPPIKNRRRHAQIRKPMQDEETTSTPQNTQISLDKPGDRDAGIPPSYVLLRPWEMPMPSEYLPNDEVARTRHVHMLEIAAQKDRRTLLKQALNLWHSASRIVLQQRRVEEIERALEAHWEPQFQHAARTCDHSLVWKAFSHWGYLTMTRRRETDKARLKILRIKYFGQWLTATAIQELKVEQFIKRKFFHKLLDKSREQQTGSESLKARIQCMQDWRVARKYFGTWLLRTRMVFKADDVNALRMKQNAFSAWNEKLRFKAVKERTDERVIAEGMYRWVIAQRERLIARRCQQRRSREALHGFIRGCQRQQQRLVNAERQVVTHNNTILTRWTWGCWRLQMTLQRERLRLAMEFHHPKIELDSLVSWRDRLKHNQRQELRADDAQYYFLMTKIIKVWRNAAIEAKKKRVNEAYKRARRTIKVNLLHGVLRKWHRGAQRVDSLQQQALAKHDQKSRGMIQSIFVRWQIGASQSRQSAQQATTHYESYILRQSLNNLIDASRQLQALQNRADQFYHIRISEICSARLRRISMKAFEFQRRENDADAMRDRHWAKHVRNILRHWALKSKDVTLVQQKFSPLTDHETIDAGYGTGTGTATATASGSMVAEQLQLPLPTANAASTTIFGATARAEEWTAFDQDLLEGSATPGYLNTPSKRAARVRALANMSTTPATPWTTGARGGAGLPLGKVTGRRAHLFRDMSN